ncbi:MAG: arginine N-succinyltransferase [Candidatus Omnitrophica bacterium]|nr:arginine N-succinyltransferase [Candidatus Omnitrophota bacterium]
MFLIRSGGPHDFKAVLKLSKFLDSYNLPYDSNFIRALLHDSSKSFQGKPLAENRKRYLFVAEDLDARRVVGSSLIIGRHGTSELPHIAFRVRYRRGKSQPKTLELSVDRKGFTELGGLVILPHYRHRAERLALQLSYARFSYMAWHPRRFKPKLLVEYLPKLDPRKGNEFWNVLGARFTSLSYREADRLSIYDKKFILSLFPKGKIDCGRLPKSVVRQLGTVGPGARASLRMLKRNGFRYLGQVDPFDGGPHYGANLREVSIVRATRFHTYQGVCSKGSTGFIMVVKRGKMKAVLTFYEARGKGIGIAADAAKILSLKPGDRVSVTPLL